MRHTPAERKLILIQCTDIGGLECEHESNVSAQVISNKVENPGVTVVWHGEKGSEVWSLKMEDLVDDDCLKNK